MTELARARLADVAERAGVSIATASKALNGRDRVSEATRRRVLAASDELGFRRDATTHTVGLLTSDLEGRFVLPILMGAEDALGAGRTSVFLCDARGDAIREQHHLAALLERRVDGILVVGSRTDPRPPIGRDLPVPVIYVYAPSADPRDVSLTPDNVEAGRLAVEHLLETGRRRIAHIAGPAGERAVVDRARGIRQALAAAGVEPVAEVPTGAWSERWGRSTMNRLLADGTEVDAVLCDSDYLARGAFDALRLEGRDVPQDVAVMGFDNWPILVEGPTPGLTSIDMNLEALGAAAASELFRTLETGPAEPGSTLRPCRLVIRGSTALGL
jgi:LacI family transcriptional regulator